MADKKSKYQCWNSRANMWVLLINGRISGMQKEKFADVPVSGEGKCETADEEAKDPQPAGNRLPVGSANNPYWLF